MLLSAVQLVGGRDSPVSFSGEQEGGFTELFHKTAVVSVRAKDSIGKSTTAAKDKKRAKSDRHDPTVRTCVLNECKVGNVRGVRYMLRSTCGIRTGQFRISAFLAPSGKRNPPT